MAELELIDVEGEPGLLLPEEMLSRLGVGIGDDLILSANPFGYLLTAAKPSLENEGADLVP